MRSLRDLVNSLRDRADEAGQRWKTAVEHRNAMWDGHDAGVRTMLRDEVLRSHAAWVEASTAHHVVDSLLYGEGEVPALRVAPPTDAVNSGTLRDVLASMPRFWPVQLVLHDGRTGCLACVVATTDGVVELREAAPIDESFDA